MADVLSARGDDPELLARVLEEARWGLDWVLKTRFGDGFRNGGSAISRKTNGIIGDDDDVTATARNTADVNFCAASVEALAGRVLKGIDPRTAAYALRAAAEDWRFALDRLGAPPASGAKEIWRGNFDSANVELETVSAGALGLRRSCGGPRPTRNMRTRRPSSGKTILDSQERTRPDWDIPLLGFFYTGPAKDRVLHYCHKGHEHMPVVALTALCEALPGHPDWMKWYSAVVLHSQYQMTVAEHTEPYGVLPASIYRDDEYLTVPESRRESFRKQVLQGVPLGKGRYLRLFPVWLDYRGHFGTILSQAQALEESARLRGDLQAARLAERQLEWVIGRNPFSQSTMWGEGGRFSVAVFAVLRRHGRRPAGRHPDPGGKRRAILARPEHLDIQGDLGLSGRPVAGAHYATSVRRRSSKDGQGPRSSSRTRPRDKRQSPSPTLSRDASGRPSPRGRTSCEASARRRPEPSCPAVLMRWISVPGGRWISRSPRA